MIKQFIKRLPGFARIARDIRKRDALIAELNSHNQTLSARNRGLIDQNRHLTSLLLRGAKEAIAPPNRGRSWRYPW